MEVKKRERKCEKETKERERKQKKNIKPLSLADPIEPLLEEVPVVCVCFSYVTFSLGGKVTSG